MKRKNISKICLQEYTNTKNDEKKYTDTKNDEKKKTNTKNDEEKYTNTKIVMKEIEKKTDTKITELMTSSSNLIKEEPNLEKNLINIMSDGAKEFKEKTGRNLTYGEMREMYG
jgi:predicted thioredoxin/glutaredoxin